MIGLPDGGCLGWKVPASCPAVFGALQVEATGTYEVSGNSRQRSPYAPIAIYLGYYVGKGTCDLGLLTMAAASFRVEDDRDDRLLQPRNVHPAPHQQNRRRLGGPSVGHSREITYEPAPR